MKINILIITFLLSSKLFAGNEETNCAASYLTDAITETVSHQTPFADFDLEGFATIRFTIDENNVLHLLDVTSVNKFLENHIWETLNKIKLENICSATATIYSVRIQYLQYS